MIRFELNRCEVTWSSVKSFSECTNEHKRCCYLPFSLFLVHNELHNVYGWLTLQRIFWAFSLCVSLIL